MVKSLSVCIGALLVVLLLSSDASAHGRGGTAYYVAPYDDCGISYGGYSAGYGGYAPSYSAGYGGYAPSYGYGGYGYGGYPYAGYGGYGYGRYDYGRPGYNPGGIGGPYSGLGVRPGVGFGGFGLRR
jgi:hypothetical protein